MNAQRDQNNNNTSNHHVYLHALYLHHCNLVTFIMCQVRSVTHTVSCSYLTLLIRQILKNTGNSILHSALLGLWTIMKSSWAYHHIKWCKSTDVAQAMPSPLSGQSLIIGVFESPDMTVECFLEFCLPETRRQTYWLMVFVVCQVVAYAHCQVIQISCF